MSFPLSFSSAPPPPPAAPIPAPPPAPSQISQRGGHVSASLHPRVPEGGLRGAGHVSVWFWLRWRWLQRGVRVQRSQYVCRRRQQVWMPQVYEQHPGKDNIFEILFFPPNLTYGQLQSDLETKPQIRPQNCSQTWQPIKLTLKTKPQTRQPSLTSKLTQT